MPLQGPGRKGQDLPRPMRCPAIVRQTRRNMNSDFALTLGTLHGYATARFQHLFNLSYRGPALIEPRTHFQVIRDFSLSTIISAFLVIALAIPASSADKKIIFDNNAGTAGARARMRALTS